MSDVLLLSETPYAEYSRPVTALLRSQDYWCSFNPTPAPDLDESRLPPEARFPRRAPTGGGCLTAIHKSCPLQRWAKRLKVPDPALERHISGAKITCPHNPPILLLGVYLPQRKDAEQYKSCCAALRDLCDSHPDHSVICGGDFQTAWDDPTPLGAALRSTPLVPLSDPRRTPHSNPHGRRGWHPASTTSSFVRHTAYSPCSTHTTREYGRPSATTTRSNVASPKQASECLWKPTTVTEHPAEN